MRATGRNPVFSNTTFGAPGTGLAAPMTYDDVLRKTLACLALVLTGAAMGWAVPVLMVVGFLGGFVLGLVNIFKKAVSAPLILVYALFEGMALGGLSGLLDRMYPGVAVQAVIATLGVFAVSLFLFKSGRVRATAKSVKFLLIGMGGLIIFGLTNLVLTMTGVTGGQWGLRGVEVFGIPLGVIIGILAILMAAFSLIVDFGQIQDAVNAQAPAAESWRCAFGLTLNLVWMYVEIIRVLAILRGDD